MAARRAERVPLTILAAMDIAIGGAAVSTALDLWLFALDPTYLYGLEPWFAIFNLSLVALNVWFLVGMWRQSEWAWGGALALVVVGAVVDGAGFVSPYVEFGDFGGFLSFVWMVAPELVGFAGGILVSPWAHLVLIQAPTLALLWLKPSRRWVGIGTPAARVYDWMRRS